MQIAIESTDLVTSFDGVPVRLWRGTTAAGVPCLVYIHRLAVREDQDASQFQAELTAQALPRESPPGVGGPQDLRHFL